MAYTFVLSYFSTVNIVNHITFTCSNITFSPFLINESHNANFTTARTR